MGEWQYRERTNIDSNPASGPDDWSRVFEQLSVNDGKTSHPNNSTEEATKALPIADHSNMPPEAPSTIKFPAQRTKDMTGQICPPHCNPRVTTSLWEEEDTICFEIHVGSSRVARRQGTLHHPPLFSTLSFHILTSHADNHFINGTALLSSIPLPRDEIIAILERERVRHVVESGPDHLKGTWISYVQALELANHKGITEQVYPLFVHNLPGLLYSFPDGSR